DQRGVAVDRGMGLSLVAEPKSVAQDRGMAVERSHHAVMELVRDQAGGRDLAEPSFHRAQPQVADLLLFVRAVSDPTVVFEADHEEAVVVGVCRNARGTAGDDGKGAWGERATHVAPSGP